MLIALIFGCFSVFASNVALDARHALELSPAGTVIARRLDSGSSPGTFFYRSHLPISAKDRIAQLVVLDRGDVLVVDRSGYVRALEDPEFLTTTWFRRMSKIMRSGGLATSAVVFGQLILPGWLDYSHFNLAAIGTFAGVGALSLALMARQNPAAFWTAFTENGIDLFPRVLVRDVARIEMDAEPRIYFFDEMRPPLRLSAVTGEAPSVSCAQRLAALFDR